PSPTAGEQQIDLPLAALPPGEYVVEIKAGDQDGDAKELVAFRITGWASMRSALVAGLLVSAIGLQQSVDSRQSAIEQSAIQSAVRNPQAAIQRLVTIDVIAADARDRSVDDLKPGDFELREEGALLTLESVRLVLVATGPQTDAADLIRTSSDERQ